MKTIITILGVLLALQMQNIEPASVQYIEIQRIEPYSGKNIRPLIVSTQKLMIKLNAYEKEDFKTSLMKDTSEYIRFTYNLLRTNKFTYNALEKYIYNSKNCYSTKNEQFGYLITLNSRHHQKYFFVPERNVEYFFSGAYSYLLKRKCDSLFCKNIYYR